MMAKLGTLFASFFLLLLPLMFMTTQQAGAFDLFKNCQKLPDGREVCGPCKDAPDSPVCKQADQQTVKNTNPTVDIINSAATVIAVLAGVVAVIMIVVSGFKFATAGGAAPGQRSGDPNRIKNARATLMYSIIGLVVVALAWTLTRFITERFIQ